MSLYLKQIEIGPMQNFTYLVGDADAKECVIVDPAWDVESVLKEAAADGYAVTGAVLSHAHFDHCNALDVLLKARNVPVYVNGREVEISEKAMQTGIFGFLPKEHLKIVKGGDALTMGGTRLTFLHTPGHTPGSQCFFVDGKLISGDTLFIGSCGRCDLPGGNPYELFETLNGTLAKLPDDTVLLPGHNYAAEGTTSTLGREKRANRFFGLKTLPEFLGTLGF